MVRPRPLVIACLSAIALLGPRGASLAVSAPAETSSSDSKSSVPEFLKQDRPKETPYELKPYKIRAWVSVDPSTRLDHRGRENLIRTWLTLSHRFIGQPWDVEVAEGEGPLLGARLEDLQPEEVAPLAQGFDKAWAIQVRPIPGGYGLQLSGREYDTATAQVGLTCSRPSKTIDDASRAMLLLSLDMFAPTAQIGKKSGGGVTIKVQGAMLPASNPVGQVVQVGSVFRASRVIYNPDGSVRKIFPIARTYLRVQALEGPVAYCGIISKLRDPLTSMIVGRYKVVAVGIRPTAMPTKLRFLGRVAYGPPEDKRFVERPASGYTLTARPAPDGPQRIVGITDRDGRIELPPYFDDGLVILRLLAANIEPLDEIPLMPGELEEERTYIIDPKTEAVTLEAELNSLRDQIVDQVAVRARLDIMIRPRVEAENWDEVFLLLEEYNKLPKRDFFTKQIEALKSEAQAEQQKIRRPILTRTATRLMMDTTALVERYIDDETFRSYADAYDRYAATAPPEKARKRTLPTERPEAALAGLATPSAASAGLEESRAGLSEFLPPGLGFRIAMPGAPSEQTEPVQLIDEKVDERRLVVEDAKRGNYMFAFYEQTKPIARATPSRTPSTAAVTSPSAATEAQSSSPTVSSPSTTTQAERSRSSSGPSKTVPSTSPASAPTSSANASTPSPSPAPSNRSAPVPLNCFSTPSSSPPPQTPLPPARRKSPGRSRTHLTIALDRLFQNGPRTPGSGKDALDV